MAKNEKIQGKKMAKIEKIQGKNLAKIEKIQGKKLKGMLLPPLAPPLSTTPGPSFLRRGNWGWGVTRRD